MSDARTRTVFFPYIYGEESLGLELIDSQLDGKSVDVQWDSEGLECDLSSTPLWSSAVLRFRVVRDPASMWIPDLVPNRERTIPPVRLMASVHCGATFWRAGCEGVLDVKEERGHIDVPLKRSLLADSADLDLFVVRASAQSTDPSLASDAAARIIAARRITIRIDAPRRRPGPGLNIEWESFRNSKHPYRAAHSGALFHLDTSHKEPILFLNQDTDPDLYAVLADEAPRGKKASLRNALFAAIAFPVWTCLVRSALTAVDPEGNIDRGWQRNVLAEVAAVAEPNCDDEEAIRRFVRDLRDPSGGRGIEERLPVIIAEMISFRKRAEDLVGVLL